jgi:hypothetical protein
LCIDELADRNARLQELSESLKEIVRAIAHKQKLPVATGAADLPDSVWEILPEQNTEVPALGHQARGLCCKNNSDGETELAANLVGRLFSFQSEDFPDELNLPKDIPFRQPPHLAFPDHVQDLVARFDVRVLDPVSLAGGVAMILAASLLASYLPARRASHLDPMVALRYE